MCKFADNRACGNVRALPTGNRRTQTARMPARRLRRPRGQAYGLHIFPSPPQPSSLMQRPFTFAESHRPFHRLPAGWLARLLLLFLLAPAARRSTSPSAAACAKRAGAPCRRPSCSSFPTARAWRPAGPTRPAASFSTGWRRAITACTWRPWATRRARCSCAGARATSGWATSSWLPSATAGWARPWWRASARPTRTATCSSTPRPRTRGTPTTASCWPSA